jgi:hypothetical protein
MGVKNALAYWLTTQKSFVTETHDDDENADGK